MVLIFTLLILLASAFKGDEQAALPGGVDVAAPISPLLASAQHWSLLVITLAAALGVVSFFKSKRATLKTGYLAYLFLALTLAASIRSIFFSFDDGLKVLAGCAIGGLMILVYQKEVAANGYPYVRQRFLGALRTFSLTLIFVNLLNCLAGYGFALGNPRLFGTAGHPNFLGVQLAMSNLILLFWSPPKLISKLAVLGVLAAGLWLQVLTGSRTAILMLAAGVWTVFYLRSKQRSRVAIAQLIGLAVVAAFCAMVLPDLSGGVFDRGDNGQDTRTAVWSAMFASGWDHPFLGAGYFQGHSENSYLRAFAAYGAFFALGILGISAACVRKCLRFRQSAAVEDRRDSVVCAGLAVQLFAGSMLEGFLVDSWSLPKMIFLLTLVMCCDKGKKDRRHAVVGSVAYRERQIAGCM